MTSRIAPHPAGSRRCFRLLQVLAVLLALAGTGSPAWAETAKKIEAWSYYNSPPFLIDEASGIGLSRDLIAYLNAKLAGKYVIKLTVLPRARLNVMLAQGVQGMVVFAPSVIFGGVDGGRFLWSMPLLKDRQMIISRPKQPIEYAGPASLYGVILGGVLGHVYPAIQSDIDSGMIDIQRSTTERLLFSMLLNGRYEAITLAETSIRFLVAESHLPDSMFYYLHGDLGKFNRHLMFQLSMETERADFDAVVRGMARDSAWSKILGKYGLKPL